MNFSSVYVLLLSWILLLYPIFASPLLSGTIHDFNSNPISSFPPIDSFLPPDSPDSGEIFAVPPPPSFQGDSIGTPPTASPNDGNADFSVPPPQLPYITPPSSPIDDTTPPPYYPLVPPPASDTSLPPPQLPIISAPPSDNQLPVSPQLPIASPPPDSSLPDSPPPDSLLPETPQLPFASSPPTSSSPHSSVSHHHPMEPGTSIAPAPFGLNPSGANQAQGFGQANGGLFGQQQNSNGIPFGGQYNGCSSTRAGLAGATMALISLLLISWN